MTTTTTTMCYIHRLYTTISLIFIKSLLSPICCHPILIVISFDGFRNDYVRPDLTPHMFKLANNGVRAHMRSSFVTKTYPNHQTIATGFYEEFHGIINNEMFDPLYNETFNVDNSSDIWWNESPVIPIWIANQMVDPVNRFSASMQWPGSQVVYKNHAIKYRQEWNDTLTWNKRIDIIIKWMTDSIPTANCVFAYFDEPDTTAHEYGPFGDETIEKVRIADQTIGHLINRLEQKRLLSKTNIIILSDHGMAEVKSDRVINLNTFLDPDLYHIYGASPVWSIEPKHKYEEQVYQTLLNASKTKNFTVYKREDIPEYLHYKKHRRILSIFIVADEGWDIYKNMTWTPKGIHQWGNHGYDNRLESMRPLFIANGPTFKSGYNHTKPFVNVDLYPLMLYVLQLYPTIQFPSNGSLTNIWDILIPPIYADSYDSSAQKWFNFIFYIFGGFGILFFGSVCLICSTNIGKSVRSRRSTDVVWESLGSGLDIDLRSHLDPSVNDFSKSFDDDIISRANRLQKPEETLLLLEDSDEEDL
ncbi:bis(5'-adenosyl)-triphosphatase ENPP4-like [Oppia nitens]|uniref:bis(5'-adenosyl)-triphosphatase ENPP4-like n=1 Tax=Oppia nitens TaxID=1686743 RepID=UPI0023DB598B|nr:bis(5'-adenosyl)-triphosphatase ENPP4-like [Oppia nitens]XP_054163175.1 bis(5'-adenosyl)-triphosphatase ENPP4-like [Oppia nitens]